MLMLDTIVYLSGLCRICRPDLWDIHILKLNMCWCLQCKLIDPLNRRILIGYTYSTVIQSLNILFIIANSNLIFLNLHITWDIQKSFVNSEVKSKGPMSMDCGWGACTGYRYEFPVW